ncbi:hypothetical protein DL770_003839 [Monosporascus sp. CRB-9-2]|nr:hypothetical protein DL770_003839 [Monosporascus sp. CRB-9-2]
MGDPLSVTASVIAILQLAAKTTQYCKDFKDGSTDRVRLRDELRSATCLLEMLKDRIEDVNDMNTDTSTLRPASIEALKRPDGPLFHFKQLLEEIVAKLTPQGSRGQLKQHLKWPFDRKEIDQLLVSLERCKSHISLAMQNDLAQRMKSTNIKLDNITEKVFDAEARSHDEEARKIISWISPKSVRTRHISVLESVQPGTGTWLLEHGLFRSWVEGDVDLLWCPGIRSTYSDTLRRIYSQDDESVSLAESVLFWVVCARRPLTLPELQHIYATRGLPEDTGIEEDDLPDADVVTSVCRGLVKVESKSQEVRAVHYTAQQFFENSYGQKIREAKSSLTRISLTYLTLPNFSDGICPSDICMFRRLERYPFLDYAAKYWGSEAKELGDEMWPHLQKFAANSVAVAVTSQASAIHNSRFFNWSQEFPRGVPALALAASFDLPPMLRRLVADGHDIEGRGSDGETPLIRAATRGLTENVRVLLDLGACVNARDCMNDTSLLRAAKNGHEDTIRVLLERSADLNMKGLSDWTALMSAVTSGNIQVVQLLVRAGADLSAESAWGDSALSIATRHGQVEIATFLADNGAILPKGQAGRRASIVASCRGYHQLVRRLTADYEAIAERPLQRQSSVLMVGLPEIQENEELSEQSAGQRESQHEASEFQFDDVSDMMAALNYKVFAVKRGAGGRSMIDEFQAFREFVQHGHPNIIRMVDLFFEPNLGQAYLILEVAPEGELFNYIVTKTKLTEMEARGIFLQLFSALQFLMWHLKSLPNIVIDGTGFQSIYGLPVSSYKLWEKLNIPTCQAEMRSSPDISDDVQKDVEKLHDAVASDITRQYAEEEHKKLKRKSTSTCFPSCAPATAYKQTDKTSIGTLATFELRDVLQVSSHMKSLAVLKLDDADPDSRNRIPVSTANRTPG